MIGRIVLVREDGHFCFVKSPELPRDAFLHGSDLLLPEGIEFSKATLRGREVDFELGQASRGPIALKARLISNY